MLGRTLRERPDTIGGARPDDATGSSVSEAGSEEEAEETEEELEDCKLKAGGEKSHCEAETEVEGEGCETETEDAGRERFDGEVEAVEQLALLRRDRFSRLSFPV